MTGKVLYSSKRYPMIKDWQGNFLYINSILIKSVTIVLVPILKWNKNCATNGIGFVHL